MSQVLYPITPVENKQIATATRYLHKGIELLNAHETLRKLFTDQPWKLFDSLTFLDEFWLLQRVGRPNVLFEASSAVPAMVFLGRILCGQESQILKWKHCQECKFRIMIRDLKHHGCMCGRMFFSCFACMDGADPHLNGSCGANFLQSTLLSWLWTLWLYWRRLLALVARLSMSKWKDSASLCQYHPVYQAHAMSMKNQWKSMILQGPENAGSKPSSGKHGPWRQQIFGSSQTLSEVLKLITPSVHQTFVIETNEVSSVLRRHLNRQEPGSAPTELCSSAFLFQLPVPFAMAQNSSTC